jgi:CDP-glycerol glycerophosphotransferase (TagB/SpsB family)
MWTKFINHPRLKEAAEHYGYCLNVRQHPIFQPYRDRFPFLPHILQRQDSFQENYARSALIVTDYSSSVYDFAYLRKPIVYFQFDRTTFFSGYHHTLGETIPKYEEVGLGEVTTEVETAVDILCDYMKNGCILKPKYRERIDAFFAFNDQHACERIYNKLQAFCME